MSGITDLPLVNNMFVFTPFATVLCLCRNINQFTWLFPLELQHNRSTGFAKLLHVIMMFGQFFAYSQLYVCSCYFLTLSVCLGVFLW